MNRPLVISDCDEVLLHMVAPFRAWLAERHGVDFTISASDFSNALHDRATGELVAPERIWSLLDEFFEREMDRQSAIEGAVEGIAALRDVADVVVLTNVRDHHRERRTRQLARTGIDVRVFTNQGHKGPALQAILDEYRPGQAIFIDDLPQHHGSVKELAPHVHRLQLCGEPLIAPHITCAHKAGHAHARIDQWSTALPWLLQRLQEQA